MCGIGGLWDPTVAKELRDRQVHAMAKSLSHRGPDAAAVWHAPLDPVSLAHTRLAIQGLGPGGAQPMTAPGRGTLVYNGELFATSGLRERLLAKGVPLRGTGDTELLLHAILEWGFPRVLGEISGQFAFVYFDHVSRRLYFARDRMGIRPFYFARLQERFAFASEQKGLLLLDWIGTEPHLEQWLRYLVLGRTDDVAGETMLRDVRSLPAGHWGFWDGTHLFIDRYFRLATQVEATTTEDVAKCLRQVVDDQLVGEVPLGSMVSGGLDSSAITLLADRARTAKGDTSPFHLFLYHDKEAEADEREYQQAVLDVVRSPHEVHWVSSSPTRCREDLARYIHHQEEPYQDLSSYAEYTIAREAHASGVKILLNGLGGDEVFVGYPSYLGAMTLELLQKRELRSTWDLFETVADVTRAKGARSHLLAQAVYQALPVSLRNGATAYRSGRVRNLPLRTIARVMSDAARSWHGSMGDRWEDRTNGSLRGSLESWSVPRFLTHSDRMCLAHGVEGRVPFLDERLIRAAFGTPIRDRATKDGLKGVLREATRDVLPPSVIARRWKLGFHAPVRPYVKAVEPILRESLSDLPAGIPSPLQDWDALSPASQWSYGALGLYARWLKNRGQMLSL